MSVERGSRLLCWALFFAALLAGQAAAQDKAPTHEGKTVGELVAMLKDKDYLVRYRAVIALEKVGLAAVPALIDALKDKDYLVRQWAAIALGFIGVEAKTALPALIDALKDKDSGVSSRAGAALKEIDSEAAKKAGVP